MSIISFAYDKLLIEKKKPIEAPLSVDNGMKIVDIKEEDVALGGGRKEKVLRIFFDYKVNYKPDQAEILLAGNLVFFEDSETHNKVLKVWEKEQKLPGEVMQLIMNNVLLRCQVKALALGQDLGLPPHIRLPTVTTALSPKQKAAQAKSKAEDYIG